MEEVKLKEDQIDEMAKKCEMCIDLSEERARAYDILKYKYDAQQR